MDITFRPLEELHFPLLLKWLETPHVKEWWDRDIKWDLAAVKDKYITYVKGFKPSKIKGKIIKKPIYAFIIYFDNIPIGYIQYYNVLDFARDDEYDIAKLPENCAAFDWYIGEHSYVGRGIGTLALKQFINDYIFKNYDYVYVDSESSNLKALKVYEKLGFQKIDKKNNNEITHMIKSKKTIIIYLIGKPGTGKYSIAQELAKEGYTICDNQHINNPIFSLLHYDGKGTVPEFAWKAIEGIRNSVFEFLSNETHNNYILTNALGENEYDHEIFNKIERVALKRDSVFIPVKLLISYEENIKRIQNPERKLRYKSIDLKKFLLMVN